MDETRSSVLKLKRRLEGTYAAAILSSSNECAIEIQFWHQHMAFQDLNKFISFLSSEPDHFSRSRTLTLSIIIYIIINFIIHTSQFSASKTYRELASQFSASKTSQFKLYRLPSQKIGNSIWTDKEEQ